MGVWGKEVAASVRGRGRREEESVPLAAEGVSCTVQGREGDVPCWLLIPSAVVQVQSLLGWSLSVGHRLSTIMCFLKL